ncbi:hypothetical protein PTKIN_Ptkin19aG0026800 [Pterospermum kingtungense]
MVEAVAAVKVLEFARELGLARIILEGDFAGIIGHLSSDNFDSSPIGLVCEKGKSADVIWVEDAPPIIQDIIINDVNLMNI